MFKCVITLFVKMNSIIHGIQMPRKVFVIHTDYPNEIAERFPDYDVNVEITK